MLAWARCVRPAQAPMEPALPPLLDRSVLFTRAAAHGAPCDGPPAYASPSSRIGAHYSPAAAALCGAPGGPAPGPSDGRPEPGAWGAGAALAAFLRAFPAKAGLIQVRWRR